MTVFFYIFNVFCGTFYILHMLFFVCVFIYLLPYRRDGHAIIFKFKLNSFHVHVLSKNPSAWDFFQDLGISALALGSLKVLWVEDRCFLKLGVVAI